jgi:hypothetical protein
MGISINYYRVDKAENIVDLKNIEQQIENSKDTKADLYKMTEHLGIIFSNNSDPYADTSAMSYKLLFGHYANVEAGWRTVNGFVPTSEISLYVKWIREKGLNNFEGFSKLCDNLSPEAKQQMEDIGGLDKKELYYYTELLTNLYFSAEKNKNSIVIVGE